MNEITKQELLKTAKPILFNTEMVRAILDGHKTQTRRVCKDMLTLDELSNTCGYFDRRDHYRCTHKESANNACFSFECPIALPFGDANEAMLRHDKEIGKYQKGDILYVRETFVENYINSEDDRTSDVQEVFYRADNNHLSWVDDDDEEINVPWKPSTQMLKKYARIFLKVTDVRVERLWDISDEDVEKEGVFVTDQEYPRSSKILFAKLAEIRQAKWINLWNSTSKDGYKWQDNHYVFAYEFEVIKNEK